MAKIQNMDNGTRMLKVLKQPSPNFLLSAKQRIPFERFLSNNVVTDRR